MASKLSIEAIEAIDAIVRKGSFAAAAESLHRVPSALTYTIRKLEKDLGVTLFNRSGHRAILTEAGAELLKEGRFLLDAAHALELRVKRIATGVETDITLAICDLFNLTPVFSLLERFYQQGFGTRIKLTQEVFGGSWDALETGRANIAIGAPGDPPSSGYTTHLLGPLEFVFAVAVHHPLASMEKPLTSEDIMPYRAVVAADSSRNLAPRTSGILSGQDTLTVPDMYTKLEVQIMGLGVGFLPIHLAQKHSQLGQLVIKQTTESRGTNHTYLAWRQLRNADMGKTQQWLLKQLKLIKLAEFMQ